MSKSATPRPRLPAIGAQEWALMELLWERSPQSAYDLIEALSQRGARHPNTIRTMLARLTRKGLLEATPYKNLYLYSARRSREEVVAAESQSFLERVFGGVARSAILHFASREKLSAGELRELKRLLDRHSQGPTS